MENKYVSTFSSPSNEKNELSKPQFMRLNLTKWVNIYAIMISIFEIVFWYFLYYQTIVINVLFIIHQLFILINTVKVRQSKSKASNEYRIIRNYNIFILHTFCIVFIVDIIVSGLVFNVQFVSYDEYEQFFCYLFVLTSIFKTALAKYNAFLISDLDIL